MSFSDSLTKDLARLEIKDVEEPHEQEERTEQSKSISAGASGLKQEHAHGNEEPVSGVEVASHAEKDSAGVSFYSYQYSSLTSPTAIRLIELQPGEDSDPICCTLSTINLEDAPSFEALSYVWGNPRNTWPIFCFNHGEISQSNKSILQATVNCCHALHRLRHESQTRRLWIDAICINQKDDTEKAQQIGLMGNLYRKADCVLVYLGCEEDKWGNTPKVFDLFRDIAKKAPFFPAGIQPSAFNYLERQTLLSFRKFFERPWFKRCWTLQEIGLARRAILICDGDELEWDVFFSVICWIDKNQLLDKIQLDLPIQGLVNSVSLYAAFEKNDTSGFASPPDFLDVLKAIRNREATNPKDRIYAFLGHPTAVDEEGPLVIPSYAQFNWIAFYKFTLTYLKRTQNLRILSAVDHGKKLPPAAFPLTWIPWWNPSTTLSSFGMSTLYDASAGANESQDIRFAGQPLEDIDIDHVLQNSPLAYWEDLIMSYSSPNYSSESETTFIKNLAMRQMMSIFNSHFQSSSMVDSAMDNLVALYQPKEARLSVRGLILDEIRLVWPVLDSEDVTFASFSGEKDPKKHIVEILCNSLDEDGFPPRYEDPLLALSLTLTGGLRDSKPVTDDLDGYRASFTEYRQAIQNTQAMLSKYKQEFREAVSEYQQKWPNLVYEEEKPVDTTQEHFQHVNKWQQFMIDAGNACQSRRFFTTTSGFFGLGPEAMLAKEVYCVILFGARAPFILQKNGDAYRLVGEAYVHGAMNGEAIDMWKSGELEDVEFQIY